MAWYGIPSDTASFIDCVICNVCPVLIKEYGLNSNGSFFLHMGPCLRIFISPPLSPTTPFCCSEPSSGGWTESGVHHCTGPPWGNTIFLCVPRWVSAWRLQICWDLISYWCVYWVCIALDLLEGWVHIFPQWDYQQNLSPLPGFLEAVEIS